MKKYYYIFLLISLTDIVFCQEVEIGGKIWSCKNLNTNKFRNGDLIFEATSIQEWQNFLIKKKSAWCYYDFDPKNEKYGKLYNWYAIVDNRSLAPKGWHISTDEEWSKLSEFIGGDEISGKKLKSKEGWLSFEGNNSNGSNIFGFNALPGGYYGFYSENFDQIEFCGAWWTSTQNENLDIWIRIMSARLDSVDRTEWNENAGFSVRCVKD